MMPGSLARMVLIVSDSLELSIIAKATIALGLALVAVRAARRSKASLRHVVLASAFGVLLLLPPVVRLLPPWAVSVPVSVSDDPVPLRLVVTNAAAVDHLPPALEPPRTVPERWSPDVLAGRLRVVWGAVAALFLIPLFAALWRLEKIRRRGLPWIDGRPMLQALVAQAGIRRSIDILRHESIATPVTCGFARPAIVLPMDVDEWPTCDVRRAIVHELEHVRRADWPVQLAARVICAAYWFHPLVWIAWRHLCLESERACDDAVLHGEERTGYAEQLVTLASRQTHAVMTPMLSMASRSDLSTRVTAVLDPRLPRGRAGVVSAGVTMAIAVLVVIALSPLRAVIGARQSSTSDQLSFDVASVKPNVSGDPRVRIEAGPGGRFAATNAPLRTLIREAYALQGFQLLGGPAWLESERFDVIATSETNRAPAQSRVMLRTLLAERFKLSVHHETRELPVYTLVLARSDGRLGPRLRPSGAACSEAPEWNGGGPPPTHDPQTPCRGVGPTSGGAIRFRGVTLDAFANFLATPVRRPVINRTGLAGDFDIELGMTAEFGPPPPPPGMPERFDRSDEPSIFTALQEQLGLKLDSRRGPVDVLVIDRVEPLIPN